MAKFTLLELHLEDANLTANAPYSRGEKDVVASDEPPSEESGSKKGALLALLVGLAFSIAVAYLVRKKLREGADSDGETETGPEPSLQP